MAEAAGTTSLHEYDGALDSLETRARRRTPRASHAGPVQLPEDGDAGDGLGDDDLAATGGHPSSTALALLALAAAGAVAVRRRRTR